MSTFSKYVDTFLKYYFIENPLGQIVIYLITGLFFIAITCLLKHLWRYKKKEEVALAGVKANATHIEHQTDSLAKREALLFGVDRTTLVADRVNAIYEIVSQNHTADQEQLAAVTVEKESSRLGILTISYVARSLILLGLLGTFIGLTIVAVKFGSFLGQVDTRTVQTLLLSMAKITEELGKTTEGLITAFATTLWGLVGTIILAFSVLFLDHSRQRFLARLEDVTALNLLPIFNPRLFPEAIEKSSKQLAKSATEIRDTLEKLETSAQKTLQGVTELGGVVNSFQTTADSFRGSAEMISAAQLQINGTLANLGNQLATADNREASLYGNVQQIVVQIGAQQQQFVNLLARLQASETTVEKVVDNCLQTISSQRTEVLEKINGFVIKHDETLQEIARHQVKFDEFIKNVQKQNAALVEQMRALNKEVGLVEVLQKMKGLLDTQEAYIAALKDASIRYKDNIKIRVKSRSTPPQPQTIGGFFKKLFAMKMHNL